MPAAKKAAAKKTASPNRWKSGNATAAAMAKFDEGFDKAMGAGASTGRPKRSTMTTTGSLALDYAVTIGGVPSGRIIEIWGPEHAGKTTLAIIMAIQHQRAHPNKMIAWVDMEQTFDEDWAQALGLDTSRRRMRFYTPDTAEDVADATKKYVHSGLFSFVVLDSVGGMISRIEMDKNADEDTVGLVPKIVTRMVKACAPAAYQNDTTLCVINQVRAKIGAYGPDEDTGGGWALKHITTLKLQVKRTGGEGATHQIKRPTDERPVPVGYQMSVRVQKNKMAPYGQVAMIWLHNVETSQYGPVGFDMVHETFGFAKRFRLMGSGAGGNYEVEGEKIRGGEPMVLEYLREHPEVVGALREKILATVKDQITEAGNQPPEVDDPLGMSEMAG